MIKYENLMIFVLYGKLTMLALQKLHKLSLTDFHPLAYQAVVGDANDIRSVHVGRWLQHVGKTIRSLFPIATKSSWA